MGNKQWAKTIEVELVHQIHQVVRTQSVLSHVDKSQTTVFVIMNKRMFCIASALYHLNGKISDQNNLKQSWSFTCNCQREGEHHKSACVASEKKQWSDLNLS